MANGENSSFLLGVAAGFIDTIYFETSFIESLSVSIILISIALYYTHKEGQDLEIKTQAFVRQNERNQKEWEEASRTWRLKAKHALKGMSNTFNNEYLKKRYSELADSLDHACLTAPIVFSGNIMLNIKVYLEIISIRGEFQRGVWNKCPEIVDAWRDFNKSGEKLENLRRMHRYDRAPCRDSAFPISSFLYMFSFVYLLLVGIFSILGMLFL